MVSKIKPFVSKKCTLNYQIIQGKSATLCQWLSLFITMKLVSFLKDLFKCLFIFERQSASGGKAEREGDTESEAGSRL